MNGKYPVNMKYLMTVQQVFDFLKNIVGENN